MTLTNDEITRRLGWVTNHGKGHFSADGARYSRARQHAMEAVDEAGRCCVSYRLNYRKAGRGESILSLIDSSGELGEYERAAVGAIYGWCSRQRQSATENRRISEQLIRLADWVIARGDKTGYRILTAASVELDRNDHLSPQTLGELMAWAQAAA